MLAKKINAVIEKRRQAATEKRQEREKREREFLFGQGPVPLTASDVTVLMKQYSSRNQGSAEMMMIVKQEEEKRKREERKYLEIDTRWNNDLR